MDVLFKNSHTRDKKLISEIFRHHFFGSKWLVFLYAALALYFFMELADAIMGYAYDLIVLICVPTAFATVTYLYYTSVNTTIKRDIELHGKEIECQVAVTDELIRISSSTGSETRVEYSSIKKGFLTKNTVVLITATRMMLIFTNDGFEIGTKEDFIAFLKTKGIKIKSKKKKEK